MEKNEQQISELKYNETVLSNQDLIETLVGKIAVYTKESTDSKTLRARIHQNTRDIETGLKLLNKDWSIDAVESMRLSKPARSKLQKLVSQHTKMEQSLVTAEKDLKTVTSKWKVFQRNCLKPTSQWK